MWRLSCFYYLLFNFLKVFVHSNYNEGWVKVKNHPEKPKGVTTYKLSCTLC